MSTFWEDDHDVEVGSEEDESVRRCLSYPGFRNAKANTQILEKIWAKNHPYSKSDADFENLSKYHSFRSPVREEYVSKSDADFARVKHRSSDRENTTSSSEMVNF